MKKNKTIAYMLAATLLVGGTFVGTKAWFSDKVQTDNGIKITMGTLDLELEETHKVDGDSLIKGWQLVRNGEPESNLISSNGVIKKEFLNIRPGDKFTREVKITNKGTLDQMVKVLNTKDVSIGNVFKLEIEGDNDLLENNEFILESGKSKTVKITLTPDAEALVNKDYNHADHNGTQDKVEDGHVFDLNKALGTLEITVRQVNATETELSPEHE